MPGTIGLARLAVSYLYKDEFHLDPSTVSPGLTKTAVADDMFQHHQEERREHRLKLVLDVVIFAYDLTLLLKDRDAYYCARNFEGRR